MLVDVTPYTFGTSALGEFEGEIYPYSYVPIIPRNTPIPVRKSEVFFTVADDQTQVDVRIYQGENADALQNIKATPKNSQFGICDFTGIGCFTDSRVRGERLYRDDDRRIIPARPV